jgi:integrase
VREYASLWLEEVRARAHPKTLERYSKEYSYYIDPEIGSLRLRDVTRLELKRLIARHAGRGLNPSMLLRDLSNLFAAAADDGRISVQPARRLWKVVGAAARTVDVRAFTKEQLARFLELSTTEPLYRDLFRTMAFAGLRAGEARALQAGDVHELAGMLDVVRTFSGDTLSPSTKTKAARRIEIPGELAELLGRRARGRLSSAWLFDRDGAPLRERAVSEAFRRILSRADLPAHHGTHSLRHTYASNLIQDGVSIAYVQRQLGHKSIKQTVDVYGRWLTLSDVEALDRFVAGTKRTSRGAGAQAHGGEPDGGPEEESEGNPGRLLRFPQYRTISASRILRSTPAPLPRTFCSPSPGDDSETETA